MAAEYATFGLAPATRAGGVLAGGDHQAHRDFTDFLVDGDPLLHRLADLDAVSPLAADVPPAIFTEQVRALLLETPAPLPGGRYVLYGCPECEDLACGAVTAVILREGDDVIWRDFAWQTSPHADLDRDGYHGIGPYRFSGAEYRTALTALLDGAGRPRRRVLLIGPRVALVARLAAALRTTGIGADTAPDTDAVPAGELRAYGAVAFAPTVPEAERAAVRAAFARAGAETAFVEDLPPVVPLLVARVEHALRRGPAERHRLVRLSATGTTAEIEVASPCRVRLTAYRLDRLRRTRVSEVFDGLLTTGAHRLDLPPETVRGRSYLVARTPDAVLVAPVEHPAERAGSRGRTHGPPRLGSGP
ncbi:oxidoreductase [Streptomyces tagetis]|uniref:oxidoreductase n=1 Tax=Streptomyces tagetis TaxID=2820809 RepID=UPI001FF7FB4F|nr:oxidoreductase [Streptomyces sp. RG38]